MRTEALSCSATDANTRLHLFAAVRLWFKKISKIPLVTQSVSNETSQISLCQHNQLATSVRGFDMCLVQAAICIRDSNASQHKPK